MVRNLWQRVLSSLMCVHPSVLHRVVPSPEIRDPYNQKVHFTTRRCTLQPRGTLQPGSCKKVVSVKLFWKLAGALETVCICKGTLDSRIMLVAKLPQMRKTMVFDASGNQTHETRTNAIQGQLILTRISWQALCKTDFKMDLPDRAKCAGQCTNVSPHRAIIFSTGPEPTHCCTEPAFCCASQHIACTMPSYFCTWG